VEACPSKSGLAGGVAVEHLGHSLGVWAPPLLHGLQTEPHKLRGQPLAASAAIQRQINQRLVWPTAAGRRLAIEADLAQRAAVEISGDQEQPVGIGQAGLKPALVIGRGDWIGRKAMSAHLGVIGPAQQQGFIGGSGGAQLQRALQSQQR
jgi:hypothetical protein